jgi:prevent-host-death family protein
MSRDLEIGQSESYGHYDHIRRYSMARKALSVAEAKASLSDAIREVEGGSTVIITRHGKPVAALVKPEDADKLEVLRAAGPQQGLVSVAGGWLGSEGLVANIAKAARRGKRRPVRLD